MKQITREWIDKAEADWISAQRMLRARKKPHYETVCFQAHESAEKYLKARLQEAGVAFDRTLSLKKTMKLVFSVEPDWKSLPEDLSKLSPYTIDYLYPGKQANKAEAQDAISRCRRIRDFIRTAFGLPV
ncbi:MAG: HEPN domain-containing protein [Blastocatellia bacterium]